MKKFWIFVGVFSFCIAVFVLIAGKFRDVGRLYLHADSKSGYDFGDLYQMTRIDEFKQDVEKYPIRPEDTSFAEAEVFVIGDSFAGTNFGSDRLANVIEDEFDVPVRFLWDVDVWFLDPVRYFERTGFLEKMQKSDDRYLILESVERYTWNRGMNYWKTLWNSVVNSSAVSLNDEVEQSRITLRESKDKIEKIFFDFEFVNYFWRNNIVFFPVHHWMKNQRWEFFGWKSDKVMIGSWNMLFYREEIGFAQMSKSDENVRKLAENISILDKELKKKYDLNLIYIAIPDKLTIYPEYYDYIWEYDDYLPRLQVELDRLDVEYVDVYSLFLDHKNEHPNEMLYYLSDTHYTAVGKMLMVELLRNKK